MPFKLRKRQQPRARDRDAPRLSRELHRDRRECSNAVVVIPVPLESAPIVASDSSRRSSGTSRHGVDVAAEQRAEEPGESSDEDLSEHCLALHLLPRLEVDPDHVRGVPRDQVGQFRRERQEDLGHGLAGVAVGHQRLVSHSDRL